MQPLSPSLAKQQQVARREAVTVSAIGLRRRLRMTGFAEKLSLLQIPSLSLLPPLFLLPHASRSRAV